MNSVGVQARIKLEAPLFRSRIAVARARPSRVERFCESVRRHALPVPRPSIQPTPIRPPHAVPVGRAFAPVSKVRVFRTTRLALRMFERARIALRRFARTVRSFLRPVSERGCSSASRACIQVEAGSGTGDEAPDGEADSDPPSAELGRGTRIGGRAA
ncbi:MAG: hypothetical protein HND43_10840 [Armatimonadetes bacterium]|nr:hypothetical protein [Armatimonadota bacterium]NOG39867.1 hypothetical protein [Armatimonadota bacterium]